LAGERRQPVVHLVGRDDVLGHVFVDLVIGQEPLRLAHRDELALLALALLVRRLLGGFGGGAVLGRLRCTRYFLAVVVVHVVVVLVVEVVIPLFTASAGLFSALPWFVEARRRAVKARCWRLHPPVTAHPSANACSSLFRRPRAESRAGPPISAGSQADRRGRKIVRPSAPSRSWRDRPRRRSRAKPAPPACRVRRPARGR